MKTESPIIAAVDVGTNSFHMVIASVDDKGLMQIKSRDKEMVRLGSSGGDMKYLQFDAIRRGVATLKNFAAIAKAENAILTAVATSATREAVNKDEFLDEAKREAGIDIEVVSGDEEGRLIYIGALHALPIYDKKILVIDIGGGSTETVVGLEGNIVFVNSQKLGAIRMTKAFFESGNSNKESIEQCREYIKGAWAPKLEMIKDAGFEQVIGTSGTIQTLANMVLANKKDAIPERLNGITIQSKDIFEVVDAIVNAGSTKRRELLAGMEQKRADIILGGSLIYEHILKELHIEEFTISSYALREGIVFDRISKAHRQEGFGHLNKLRRQTVYGLCDHYRVELEHAEHVRRIALKIFDGLADLHKLDGFAREMMEVASLLHDVGYHISHDQHHKHSYYILMHCIMPGFSNTEAEIVANIARYHRKSPPKKKHENFTRMPSDHRNMIRVLSGILRIAEGIDRRQLQLVEDILTERIANTFKITLVPSVGKDYPDIELWGAGRRKMMLENLLGLEIELELQA